MQTEHPFIITIDGPAGVGKSTLARRLAEALGLPYLDTGAMFRFLALKLAATPPEQIAAEAKKWRFSLEGAGEQTRLLANDQPIGQEIRTEEAGKLASELGKRPEIRAILAEAQRELGQKQSLVAEGRDLGAVIFPHAPVKFFLDARPEIRAKRRWHELANNGKEVDLAQITKSIRERDSQDRNRPIAPLKPAEDAVIIDTSDLDIDQALARLVNIAANAHPNVKAKEV